MNTENSEKFHENRQLKFYLPQQVAQQLVTH